MLNVFIFIFVLFTSNGHCYKKPSWLPTCLFKDNNYAKCSTNSTAQMFVALRKGLPNIGVPPIEPFKINNIQISQSDNGPMRLSCSVKNVTLVGLGSIKVLYNSVDNKTHDCTTRVHIDKLTIQGQYDMKGQLLFLPLQGSGDCWFKVRNVSISSYIDADLYKKHGHYFYNATGIHVKFDFTGLDMHLYNLFNGAKELEKRTNEYFNANWKPFADVLNPTLTQTVEEILLYLMKKVFNGIPADYWVADIGETYKPPSLS